MSKIIEPESKLTGNPFTTHTARSWKHSLSAFLVVVDLEREETGWSAGKDNECTLTNGGGG